VSDSTATAAAVPTLSSPVSLGSIELANRVVMAPLTRMRSGSRGVPGWLVELYYRQRASVGMIVTEGTYPSFESQAFVGQPGIATDKQAAGWKKVTAAVHEGGGKIVMQIMHGGRTAHPDLNGGRRVLAPSAIAVAGETHTERGPVPFAMPEAMTLEDMRQAVEDHVAAARRAIDAGFDGVEIHSANGYLLHQFLAPSSNTRSDGYGGSPENRARFTAEVVTAVAQVVGADRVGLRISPEHNIQDAIEDDRDDVLATYGALLDQLRPLGLAYLSVIHADAGGPFVQELHRRFGGKLIANTGFATTTSLEESNALIASGFISAVAVGRAVIANPDLVERWLRQHPENDPRPELFYAFGAEGYTDYPLLDEDPTAQP
jgi:2,4-dienoyl-CoA reductase-like NADH-dependent reductase (Old Yellow Enzyme family)